MSFVGRLPFSQSLGRVVPVAGLLAILAGCGVSVDVGGSEEDLKIADDAPPLDSRLVILDWSAGASTMLPGRSAPAVDFGLFRVSDGGTLADEPEFETLVEERVQEIFDDLDSPNVIVMSGPLDNPTAATRVLMTQSTDGKDPRRVGQAHYDPCDVKADGEAIVWGQAILNLGNDHTFDEWVQLFANVAAHEAAHTLGFAHPEPEDEGGRLVPESELMLASHSLESLIRPQGFQIEQENCGDGQLDDGDEVPIIYQLPELRR